ncbi:MAG: hypothetical protein QGH25_21180 [Candidatus Latescibacteria bacterium]|nr:hypothetical protein [Candidatus Latescibacterota bacterium]
MLEFPGQLSVSRLEVDAFDGFLHDHLEILVVPGLGDIAGDAALIYGLGRCLKVRIAGEHHPYTVGGDLLRSGEKLRANHIGHALVGNDERDPMLSQ